MPHAVREMHIDDFCANCKKPFGEDKKIETFFQHHKMYEIISCPNCGYDLIRLQEEKTFKNRFEFM